MNALNSGYFERDDQDQQVPWSSGPTTRGGFQILWACLSTLFLCAWTAVHPNIQLTSNTSVVLLQRLGLMVVSVLFPEIIISSAWSQQRRVKRLLENINCRDRHTAKDISEGPISKIALRLGISKGKYQQVNNDYPIEPSASANDSQSASAETPHEAEQRQANNLGGENGTQWTMEQGFFALMGGYAAEIRFQEAEQTSMVTRRIITDEGIVLLARLGLCPPMDMEELGERNNADALAKAIALVQILWFAVQVVGRLIQKSAVTLLEVHTTINVGCAILLFALWFKKPYNLTSRVFLHSADAMDIISLFMFYETSWKMFERMQARYETERANYWKRRAVMAANNILDYDPPPARPSFEAVTSLIAKYNSMSPETISETGFVESIALQKLAASASRGSHLLELNGSHEFLTDTKRRWKFLRESSENFVIRAIWGAWSTNEGHSWSLDKVMHLAFNVLYGAGHLSAWDSSTFPTNLEMWIWRGAAIFLTSTPVWAALWVGWWAAFNSKARYMYPFRDGSLDVIAAPIFFTIIWAYMLARCYFIVESLISLRLLPSSAYEEVNWAWAIPHFS